VSRDNYITMQFCNFRRCFVLGWKHVHLAGGYGWPFLIFAWSRQYWTFVLSWNSQSVNFAPYCAVLRTFVGTWQQLANVHTVIMCWHLETVSFRKTLSHPTFCELWHPWHTCRSILSVLHQFNPLADVRQTRQLACGASSQGQTLSLQIIIAPLACKWLNSHNFFWKRSSNP
jgi:hypothetical protein